jgi:hypothetical protein
MTTEPKATEAKPLTIAAKLAVITGKMRNVPKNGENRTQNYKFVRETDVAEMLSSLLAEANLFLHQTVLNHSMQDLYKTQSGMTMRLSEVDVQFTWIDGDTGERMDAAVFPGHGADTGDKGIYKALTGAEKYFLMKTFLVSTGDDPEADEKVDKDIAATSASRGSRTTVVAKDASKARRGGRSDLATDAQLAELKRLAKDRGVTNAAGMMTLVRDTLTTAGATDIPEWDTPETFAAYLRGLTSTQMGAIIVGITAEPAADTSEDASDDDTLDLG